MRNLLLIITTLAATIIGASTVRADFSIDVTIDVTNLAPEVDGVGARCEVYNAASTGTAEDSGLVAQGTFMHSFPHTRTPAPHSFKETVVVVARSTRTPPADNTATDFRCTLLLHASSSTGGAAEGVVPTISNAPWAQPEPGAPFVRVVTGKVPRSGATAVPAGQR